MSWGNIDHQCPEVLLKRQGVRPVGACAPMSTGRNAASRLSWIDAVAGGLQVQLGAPLDR